MKSKLKCLIMILVPIAAVAVISALYAAEMLPKGDKTRRSDVIVIDSMKVFGNLERPAVVFQHDIHTQALEQRGANCSTCHIDYGVPTVFLFGRMDNQNEDTVLQIYHDGCIGCHETDRSANRSSGPLECGECHTRRPEISSSRQVVNFGKSLHQRHIVATDNNCGSCHHGYDLSAPVKVLGYIEGKETSCRDCHLAEDTEKIRNYRYVAHRLCVNCHLDPLTENIAPRYEPPSTQCADCHDPDRLSKIKELDPVPRLKRGQPDITFLPSIEANSRNSMDLVAFDHQRHEFVSDDCRTCHHKSMDRCESCHSLNGQVTGGWIPLAKAMHQGDSPRGCVGCHAMEAQKTECAGCHSLMSTNDTVSDSESCQRCHNISASGQPPSLTNASDNQSGKVTHSVIRVDYESIPDSVEIDVIAEEYGSVSFPHRHIIESLMGPIIDNRLAAYFHQDKDTICAGCHHNAPDFRSTPPKCISCHEPSQTKRVNTTPDMKTAYHQQCFGCHETMNIKEPVSSECESCHLKK